MSNKEIDAAARCPFYLCEDRCSITCEGLVSPRMKQQFLAMSEKMLHEAVFCCKTYEACTVFRSVSQKYEIRQSR